MDTTVFLFIFLGVLLRTLLPALRKWKETIEGGKPFVWQHKYTVTFIISLASALSIAVTLYETFIIPEGNFMSIATAAFLAGFGWNSTVDELVKWLLRYFSGEENNG
jgi:hypothetical protein